MTGTHKKLRVNLISLLKWSADLARRVNMLAKEVGFADRKIV